MMRSRRASTSQTKSRPVAKATVAETTGVPKAAGGAAQQAAVKKVARDAVGRASGRTKVRKTLTLDPDLVRKFGDIEGGLSAAVNAALREHLARTERHDALAARIAEMEAEYGSADPADVERFARHMR